MPRGFGWCIYVDDLGRQWALRVDDDYADDPARGWVRTEDIEVISMPRQWRPRRVVGTDDQGFARTAVVASTAAPLWTGEAVSFSFERSDQQIGVAQVVRRIPENIEAHPGPGA